jgi:5-methylcytosine-specific restriction protein A
MPPRASKICSTPGCPNLQPCEKHVRKPWEGSTRGGSDKGWRKTRARILKRDSFCRGCGVRESTICDHIVARAFGGTEDDSNLQGLCRPCSDTKSGKEGALGRSRSR